MADTYEDEPQDELDPAEDQAEPDPSEYWAALPEEDLGHALADRAEEYYSSLAESGMLELYRSVHHAFYGLGEGGQHESSTIIEFGNDGEKLGVRSNQLRSLVKYIHNAATADRPVVKPKARNSTAKALAQIPTASRVLEYYQTTKRMERQFKGAALRALLYAKGYMWQSWDPNLGAEVDDKDRPGKKKRTGDLTARACSPLEVVCDLDRDAYDHDWFMVRRPRNRFDIAAIHAPSKAAETDAAMAEKRETILNIDSDCLDDSIGGQIAFGFRKRDREQRDVIYEYHFMHRKTPAMPNGRYTIMIGNGLVLFDGDLPFRDVPVREMVPEEFLELGSIGYASAWDLLGLQQAYDSMLSTFLTNFDAFGHNDILIPDGIELGVEEIRDGLNVIRFPAGEHNRPSMLEKFSIREEAFKLSDLLKRDMELNSAVNATARGEPQASLKSGTALALVQAQAIHFQSGFVGSYTNLVEDCSTDTLQLVQQFASMEQIVSIAGANDPDGLAAFSGPDISEIERAECEQVNPIFHTLAGKFDIANNLLERGLLTDLGQYYQVLETGRLEVATDPARNENLYCESVKEALLRGPAVIPGQPDPVTGQPTFQVEGLPVVITDDPVLHLRTAKAVLDSVENRKNMKVVSAATTYAMEVMRVWRAAPPDMLNLLGYPLPPPRPGDPNYGMEQDPSQKQSAQSEAHAKPAPGGKTKTVDDMVNDQKAPDKGSGMPSLPKPASVPA